MSAHSTCSNIGKLDCLFDEKVHEYTLDGFCEMDGSVEAPCGWFGKVDLVSEDDLGAMSIMVDGAPANEEDDAAIAHYGTRFLLVRENEQGFVYVIPFQTEEGRDAAYQQLIVEYDTWSAMEEELEGGL